MENSCILYALPFFKVKPRLIVSEACHCLSQWRDERDTSGKQRRFPLKINGGYEMIKISKQRFVFAAILVLLTSTLCVVMFPTAQAAELNVKDNTLSVLNTVGIDTESFTLFLNSHRTTQYLTLPQKEMDMYLVSNQSRVRVTSYSVENKLRLLYMCDYEGELSVKKAAADTISMAKSFLQGYEHCADDSFYGMLASTLTDVSAITNTTKIVGNMKLRVLNTDQKIVDYLWTYVDENGVIAQAKNIVLSYNEGRLECFLNNWPLYRIEGKPIITETEATSIAIEASRNFSYDVRYNNVTSAVTGFKIAPKSLGKATLSYLNHVDQNSTRGGDPFTLYPSWYVPLGFDKFYPGGVTGMTVSIWADTGEVSASGPTTCDIGLTSPAQEKASTQGFGQNSLASRFTLVVAPFGIISILAIARKRKLAGRKLFLGKFWVMLLSVSILFSAVLSVIPQAIASNKSEIYAALNSFPQQCSEEQVAAYWLQDQLSPFFAGAGYTVNPAVGENTRWDSVMMNAYNDEQQYDSIAVFHFGHQSESNTAYQDNNAQTIGDYYIWPNTVQRKHSFVFIWVCDQGSSPIPGPGRKGMPAAWTHRDGSGLPTLRENGYTDPDGLGQCYISFWKISPIISAYHQTFQDYACGALKWFIYYFYYYALAANPTYTVQQSLNLASSVFFEVDYTLSPLYDDATPYYGWYPGMPNHPDPDYREPGWKAGKMRVFGDTAIRLYTSPPPVYDWLMIAAYDNQFYYSLHPNVYVDSIWVGTAPLGVQVPHGSSHSVWLDPVAYCQELSCDEYLLWFSDGLGNGDYRDIYSDYWLDATYA